MQDLQHSLKRKITEFVEKLQGLLFDRGMKCWWRLCGALVILATLGSILWQQGVVRPARPAKAINAVDEQIVTYLEALVSQWGEAQQSSPVQSTTHPRGVGEKPRQGSQ